jgi:hypothetical protein
MMEIMDHTQCEVENTWQNFQRAEKIKLDKIRKEKIIHLKEIAQQF